MGRWLPLLPATRQRRPTRLTGPPRFMGVPARTPTPGAPTPGVATAAAATGARATGATTTGAGRSTTPGLTTQPWGTPTYLQYTTASAELMLPIRTVTANRPN